MLLLTRGGGGKASGMRGRLWWAVLVIWSFAGARVLALLHCRKQTCPKCWTVFLPRNFFLLMFLCRVFPFVWTVQAVETSPMLHVRVLPSRLAGPYLFLQVSSPKLPEVGSQPGYLHPAWLSFWSLNTIFVKSVLKFYKLKFSPEVLSWTWEVCPKETFVKNSILLQKVCTDRLTAFIYSVVLLKNS